MGDKSSWDSYVNALFDIFKNTERSYKRQEHASFKVAQNSFQHLYWMGRYNHFLSLDATSMVSKNFSIIGEHVAIIFLTQ